MVDPAHWDGLPDGHTRAVIVEAPRRTSDTSPKRPEQLEPLSSLLARRHADITVAARPLTHYDTAAQAGEKETNR